MPSFIKISNHVFEYGLSARALMIYVYLSGKTNCLRSTTAAYAEIAAACNMDPKTAQAGVKELERCKLVLRANRYNTRGYLANRYFVHDLVQGKKGWFSVEREVFHTQIRATNFLVFCYLRMQMSASRQEAYPSLSNISAGTGLSRGRVTQAVAWLRRFTYINRTKRRYRKTRAWRHNRYQHFKCNLPAEKRGKEMAHTTVGTDQINQRPYYNTPKRKCQAFFFVRGSPHFPKQILDVQPLPVKEKFIYFTG